MKPRLLLLLPLLLSACSLTPRVPAPEATEALPEAFMATGPDTTYQPTRWWTGFGDAALEALVDTALAQNLDLRIAAARVQEVRSLYRISGAGLWPSVQASLDGQRQETPANTGATRNIADNIPGFPERFETTTYSTSLGFAYELDFWGRVRSGKAAALHDYVATEADYELVRTGVVAEAILTYYELAETAQQLALTRANLDLLGERLELTDSRYRRGVGSSFELYALQQQYDSQLAGRPLLESQWADALGRLAVLLGRFPTEAEALLADLQAAEPSLADLPAYLPSDLLRQRPDVIAAEQRMEAQRHRVGVARADRFPRFSLTGSVGTQSSTLSDLVDTNQRFWLFGGSLVAPLFNGGALKAAEKAAWARYEQAALSYEKALLTAFADVETALTTYQNQQERYDALQAARAAAATSAETQEQRYRRGVGDYLTYLDARLNLLTLDTALAQSRRTLATARLGVHRALGGAWVE